MAKPTVHPEFNPKQGEVFAEYVDPYNVPDVKGGPQRHETWHALYRLKALPYSSDARKCGVQKQLIATVHARIIAHEWKEGISQAVIAGRGRWGETFLFRCPLRWVTSGKPYDVRRFVGALYNFAGAGTVIVPGMHAALCRAILQLSDDEEPMPSPVTFEGKPKWKHGRPDRKRPDGGKNDASKMA